MKPSFLIFLRILPIPVGIGAGYLVASSIVPFSKPMKLVAATLCIWLMAHANSWYYVHLLRREKVILVPPGLHERVLGHLLFFVGALAAGCAFTFAVGNKIYLGVAVIFVGVCFFIADEKLAPKPLFSKLLSMTARKKAGPAPSPIGIEEKRPILRPRSQDKEGNSAPPPSA